MSKELGCARYDEFNDYIEMVIQFGYIVLFACKIFHRELNK
jgi:hypothetical protein